MTSAVAAPVAAALAISAVQLVTGDALLPRFVVFGTVCLMVPWALLCTALARGGRLRAEMRDRVVLVAEPAEAVALTDELAAEPERPAVLLNHLLPSQATSLDSKSKPLTELVIAVGANVVVLDRAALADPTILSQVAALHENGIRVRTLSLFYEEWLGKLPMSELERASLLFDIREVHGAVPAREASDRPRQQCDRRRRAARRDPVRRHRQPVRQSGSAVLSTGARRQERRRASRS